MKKPYCWNVGDADRRLVILAEYEQGTPVKVIANKYRVHRTYPSVLARRYDRQMRHASPGQGKDYLRKKMALLRHDARS